MANFIVAGHHGIDTDLGLAHESAIKEAETDATKRALVTFGNPFGLALYDKSQQQVSGGLRGSAPRQPSAPAAAFQGSRKARPFQFRAAAIQTTALVPLDLDPAVN